MQTFIYSCNNSGTFSTDITHTYYPTTTPPGHPELADRTTIGILIWVTLNGHFYGHVIQRTLNIPRTLGVSLASSPLNWLYSLWNRTPACGWGPALCPWEGKEIRRRQFLQIMFVFHVVSASPSARRQPLHDHVAQNSRKNAIVGGPVSGNLSGVCYKGKHYSLIQTLHA